MPKPSFRDNRLSLLEIITVISILGIQAAIAVPFYIDSIKRTKFSHCQQNIILINQAKKAWVKENPEKDNPTIAALVEFLPKKIWPICPAGGKYNISDLTTSPTCSLHSQKNKSPTF